MQLDGAISPNDPRSQACLMYIIVLYCGREECLLTSYKRKDKDGGSIRLYLLPNFHLLIPMGCKLYPVGPVILEAQYE